MHFDLIVVGGGAGGIFSALCAKEANPKAKVLILERSRKLLSKVKISGGGRCNVTHNLFDPKLLVQNYPRGGKELLGPFHHFGPKEMINYLKRHGVKLKAEKDGRMFPVTNSSQTIIDLFLTLAKRLGIEIWLGSRIETIKEGFSLTLQTLGEISCDHLILATGSSLLGYKLAEELGHTIKKPIPSLFTFNVPSSPLKSLSGISVDNAKASILGHKQTGPLLITHFGFSGPCVIKLSAYSAIDLYEANYKAILSINWLCDLSKEEIFSLIQKKEKPPLPKSLWKFFTQNLNPIPTHKAIRTLCEKLTSDSYQVEGKTTNKEEFVTCGGVDLKEVDMRKMESKICPNLHFAGEILNIDGITGGFNFQNAWTTGYLGGSTVAKTSLTR